MRERKSRERESRSAHKDMYNQDERRVHSIVEVLPPIPPPPIKGVSSRGRGEEYESMKTGIYDVMLQAQQMNEKIPSRVM